MTKKHDINQGKKLSLIDTEKRRLNNLASFKKTLIARKFDESLTRISAAADFLECEGIVGYALTLPNVPREILTAAFQSFLDKHQNQMGNHGNWVHSLSHFDTDLWKRRLTRWIVKFYAVAFEGARELQDWDCCDRLLSHFLRLAKWSDDPIKFHLTPENLEWVKWEWYAPYAKARIEAAPFSSERDFLRWCFQHPESLYTWHHANRTPVPDERSHRTVKRLLAKHIVTKREFLQMEKAFVLKQFQELIGRIPTCTSEQERKNLAWVFENMVQFIIQQAYGNQATERTES